MAKIKTGIIGCGFISGIYLKNIPNFEHLELVACADIDTERAKAKALEYNLPHTYSVEELLADPQIQIVVNLTIPAAHAEICLKALDAGKHVYVEKPLAATREEGEKIIGLARSKGLLVGSAPDTFLGGGIQTCRKLIEDGVIGAPVAASGVMMSKGHESWHSAPEFYYELGGGPMFDMGPYYLTTLISLLGPIRRVTGSARISFPERTITSEPKAGTIIQVKTPTHIAGVLDFESGAIATLVTSFDIKAGTQLPKIEIYGSEATLSVPDPNTFEGPVMLRRADSSEFEEITITHGYVENSRGIGVADMAHSILTGEPHRASGELAYHVLEAMHGLHDASAQGKHYQMNSTCSIPAPLQANFAL